MNGENWRHQDIAIEKYKDADHFGLLFDCGTGKTRTFIGVVEANDEEAGDETPVIVICPKNIVKQWAKAIEKNSCRENKVFMYLDTECKTKAKKEQFQKEFDAFLKS